MASIQKRTSGYQVRYRDPLGQRRARQFKRKVDAERFAREVEVDKGRSLRDPDGWSITSPAIAELLLAWRFTGHP